MEKTKLYIFTEQSLFMMSYLIITKEGNCVIIDGGRPEDLKELRPLVKGKKIKAWFLTHPHIDHITAFNEIIRTKDPDFDIETVYEAFSSLEYTINSADDDGAHAEYLQIKDLIKDKVVRPNLHDKIIIDELEIDICFVFDENKHNLVYKTVNDTSLAFRVKTPNSSIMFLGDLGPESGEIMVEESADLLESEYCQMAHHGHGGVDVDCYMHINPRVCIYNARDWLYEEPGEWQDFRRYGTKRTRYWMEKLGVKEDIVTGFGTKIIEL